MSVVRVQAYAMDIWSDVTIQRYSFFEILELTLHFCNDNHQYIIPIPYTASLYFFLVFQSYRELVIITLQFAHQVLSLSIITTEDRINLGTLKEYFHRLLM